MKSVERINRLKTDRIVGCMERDGLKDGGNLKYHAMVTQETTAQKYSRLEKERKQKKGVN